LVACLSQIGLLADTEAELDDSDAEDYSPGNCRFTNR
jgi:hypothetical protein